MTRKKIKMSGHASPTDALVELREQGFWPVYRRDGLQEWLHEDGRRFGVARRAGKDEWLLTPDLPDDVGDDD